MSPVDGSRGQATTRMLSCWRREQFACLGRSPAVGTWLARCRIFWRTLMSISRLEHDTWHAYFDNMARILEGKRVEIEVDALSIGSQIQAEWLPLIGITYEPQGDMLEVALEGLDHLIRHPREIYV